MQAQSLLGSARTIDSRLEELLSANLLAGSRAAWANAAVIRETLGDVAEQLRASAPFPPGRDSVPEDGPFFDLLDALVAVTDPDPERVVETVAGGERTVDRLRDAGRVEIRASRLVVPLDRDGGNWWALLEFLCASMERLATKASRVRSRVVVDGADGSLVTAWDSVTERLDVLGDVLDEMTANGRYAGRSVTVDEQPTEFVTWTAEQFRSDR